MRYLEGFRDPDAARHLTARIRDTAVRLADQGRRARIMEVCGTHTMAIARHGLRDLLPPEVELISGPGCPVCVTAAGYVDAAVALADSGCLIATFGDLVRVPGSRSNLAEARSRGAHVEVCYSPEGALALAARFPKREVVFLAVGFETTIAPVVTLVRSAAARGLQNLSLLTAFKTVPPALAALAEDPDVQVDAFLCPAHVSAIIGSEAYRPFVERYGIGCVVAGFEPLDILHGVETLLGQLADRAPALVNRYERVVRPGGNRKAQELMATYLVPEDASWRGIGVIPGSGLALRPQYASFDAARRHGHPVEPGAPDPHCRCGDVLKGKIRPRACRLFGTACTPERPVGPCMVSSEGSCAAEHRYGT
jgi:hydrogenase expression/formation protein HypD